MKNFRSARSLTKRKTINRASEHVRRQCLSTIELHKYWKIYLTKNTNLTPECNTINLALKLIRKTERMGEKSEDLKDTSIQPKEITHPVNVLSTSPVSSNSLSGTSEKSLLESNDEITSGEDDGAPKLPSIEWQREEIQRLLDEDKINAKEGDKMYVIPKFWYDYFLNPDVDDTTLVEPIDISLICNDYEKFSLKDYNQCPYIAVPETVFNKFVEWYGLARNSQPTSTKLVWDDESESLITEYNRCFFRVQFLIAPDGRSRGMTNHHINNANYFTMSRLDTMAQSVQEALDFFQYVESNIDIVETPMKLWLVRDTDLDEKSAHLVNSYILTPIQFISLPKVTRIKPEIFKSTLRDLDFSAGTIIVEIKQHNKNYHWASNYFHYNKLSLSTGTIGLSNLGNTCYMNSALQCLVHIPQLKDYFIYNGYEKEINTDNPLGYQGNIAKAFHDLIQNLWGDSLLPLRPSFSPNNFKSMVGHCNSMFGGYMQQDSQEFLAFLLDSLHEDLNRIIKKPYVEKPSLPKDADVDNFQIIKDLAEKTWKSNLLRNDSIITDLFVGMYKSTLECPECNMVSVTFDPYNDITLPLPVNSVWHTKIRLFPQSLPPCIIEVELPKTATYTDLKNYVSRCVEIDAANLYGCEIFGHQFYNNFEMPDSNSQYLPLQELISESDIIIFYELTAGKDDVIVPILNSCVDPDFPSPSLFGIPFFLVFNPEDMNNPTLIRKRLQDMYVNLSGGFIPFNHNKLERPVTAEDFPLLSERYPDANLSNYSKIIQYATPEIEDGKQFFNIKTLDDYDRMDLSNISPQFWTPRPHINLRSAQNIIDHADNVTKDIYNYPHTPEAKSCQGDSPECNVENETNFLSNIDINNSDEEEEEVEMEVDNLQTPDIVDVQHIKDDGNAESKTNESKSSSDALITPATFLVCEWLKGDKEEAFSSDKIINWENPGTIPNKELESIQMEKSSQKDKEITLDDCFSLFSKKEVLGLSDSWYCPNCKEHRQATKRIQLWNTPDIMLIHLKRFENTRSFSDKIDDVVNFPIADFDISDHVVYKENPDGFIYDLIAVDNHYGGLGGGHYTAYAKNCLDNKWYYFDDSRVSPAEPERSIAGSAYLLFYLRRGSLNKPGKLEEIIEESRSQHQAQIHDIHMHQEAIYEENETEEVDKQSSDEMDITEDEQDNGGRENSEQSDSDSAEFVDVSDLGQDENEAADIAAGGEKEENVEEENPTLELTPKKNIDATDNLPSPAESNHESDDDDVENLDPPTETKEEVTESKSGYSTECQEVGHFSIDDVESVEKEHAARRKMRVLSKVYSDDVLQADSTSEAEN